MVIYRILATTTDKWLMSQMRISKTIDSHAPDMDPAKAIRVVVRITNPTSKSRAINCTSTSIICRLCPKKLRSALVMRIMPQWSSTNRIDRSRHRRVVAEIEVRLWSMTSSPLSHHWRISRICVTRVSDLVWVICFGKHCSFRYIITIYYS